MTVGLRAEDAPPLDRWVRYVHYQHEVFRYLEVVGLVGAVPVTLAPSFAVMPADQAEVTRVIGELPQPWVAVHPGANDPRRRWPPRRFAVIADTLAAEGYQVLLTGSAAEHGLAEQVRAHLRRPARNLAGALSLGGLAGLYAGCSLVVANDTGPLHLAAAVGTPTVGLFLVSNLMNGGPITRADHRPIASWTTHCPRCGAAAVRATTPAVAGCGHSDPFVTDIGVEGVIEAAHDLLQR